MSDTKALLQAIAKEEALLSRLDSERGQALSRLNAYKHQLAVLDAACAEPSITYATRTPREKVSLFRSLFRGREDIFPKLWTNRSGKRGYSPACSNDWISGTCGKTHKPPVKCSECSNRKFLPVTDQVIMDHLQGRHVIGVYPMLPDDTCWFLAADFDKETWMDDVRALRETCNSVSFPVVVERSRSGNGGHAWFFFSEPVPAAAAQQEPRKKGNTVFLDESFTSYEDQWAFLASIGRLNEVRVCGHGANARFFVMLRMTCLPKCAH